MTEAKLSRTTRNAGGTAKYFLKEIKPDLQILSKVLSCALCCECALLALSASASPKYGPRFPTYMRACTLRALCCPERSRTQC
eukprot:1278759-Amphidinium_carterae.1